MTTVENTTSVTQSGTGNWASTIQY
ncbi:MAG: hypothetical protein ACQEUK_07085 [Pseudomonadota bacterium]